MNPYVFIVGCPRSGTTLLQGLVNAHPQIAITPETHWIPRIFEGRKGLTREGMVTPKLISLLLEQPRFTRLGVGHDEVSEMIAGNRRVSYSSLVTAVFDSYGKAQGKPLVGDKTPGYVRRIHTLHTLWSEARFVHLIRDGRDVYLSMKYRPLHRLKAGVFDTWAGEPGLTAALWWELNVRAGRRAASSLGPGLYHEVRYESLVARPREECEALCAFLGVPCDDAMFSFHKTEKNKKAWRPVTPGLRDWRTQMPEEDLERFEAAAGELLDELRYERAVRRPRPESLDRALRMRDRLARDPRTHYASERKEMAG
ncbi:MAG TPA: sulfotransferase [Terriglobia bacterium]|nr:sulfotransferase [Terriglobia bacterium]